MNRFIKTECGLSKYDELKNNKGVFRRIRFYWFVIVPIGSQINDSGACAHVLGKMAADYKLEC